MARANRTLRRHGTLIRLRWCSGLDLSGRNSKHRDRPRSTHYLPTRSARLRHSRRPRPRPRAPKQGFRRRPRQGRAWSRRCVPMAGTWAPAARFWNSGLMARIAVAVSRFTCWGSSPWRGLGSCLPQMMFRTGVMPRPASAATRLYPSPYSASIAMWSRTGLASTRPVSNRPYALSFLRRCSMAEWCSLQGTERHWCWM